MHTCPPSMSISKSFVAFFFQAEDGIRDIGVTGVQTCALPIFKSCATHKPPRCTDHQNGLISGTRGKERDLPFCWWVSWSVTPIGGCALPGCRRERSEERRVGEGGRSRWSPYLLKKKPVY